MLKSTSEKELCRGEKRRFYVNIYQPVDNSALDHNCNPQRKDLVIPPTIVITDPLYDIYYEDDLTTPVLSGSASLTNIFDSGSTLVGYKISIIVDTTFAELSEDGDYLLVFTYTEDAAEVFKIKCEFSIDSLSISC